MISHPQPVTPTPSLFPANALDEACQALWGRLCGLSSEQGPPRLVGVTSGARGEGVSTVAAGLAQAALATSGEASVLLIDAHGKHPTLHHRFDVGLAPGLGEVLAGECDLHAAIKRLSSPGLSLLTAGAVALEDVTAAALAEGCERLINAIAAQYDTVVVDLPPAGAELLAQPLPRHLDGVVLVVEAERERWQAVQKTAEALAQSQVRIFGIALNKRPNHIPGWLYRRL